MNEEDIARLLSSDLSAESRARRRLRAELLVRRKKGAWAPALVAWFSPAFAGAAVALLLSMVGPRPDRGAIREVAPAPAAAEAAVDLRPEAGRSPHPLLSLAVAQGVARDRPNGKTVRFELAGNVFVLETRAVTAQELFGPPRGGIVSIQ